MNNWFKWTTVLLLGAVLLTTTACNDDDDDNGSILELAKDDAELSTLVAALERVELDAVLNGSDTYTVFAPSNVAFNAFLEANDFASLDDVPDAVLNAVLLNHVVAGKNMSSSLSSGYVSTLSPSAADANTNLSMYVNTTDGVVLNGVSTVTAADIEADNGVIHKVNSVIGLPTIVTHALANPNLSILVEALGGTQVNYVSLLSGEGPFTVFAPTNDAFVSFLGEKGFASLEAIPEATLDNVLQYHVVDGANVNSSAITNNMTVTTFNEGEFTVNTDNGVVITDNEGRETNVVLTDIQANNGIIHVLDKVLSPL